MTIIPKYHANYLFYTSHASLIGGLYAFYKGTPNCVYPFIVYLASINYWRNPVLGWRRNIDIATACICVTCQTISVRNHPNFNQYIITMFLGTLFYPVSEYLRYKNFMHLSTLSHSMIHIVCNIANYLLV